MGNSHKPLSLKKSRALPQSNCMACMPNNYEPYENSSNELNIFKGFSQPKGKISRNSIAYLSKDEVNFFKACAGRNISALRFYLKKGVNVNTFDEDRTSPLHVAARHATIQVVEELVNCGALIDITDSDGWTPLHVASFFQRPIVCHLLLKKGANANIPNKDNAKPSDLARESQTKEVFAAFLSKPHQTPPNLPQTPAFLSKLDHFSSQITSPREKPDKPPMISCDSLGNTEEPARVPRTILPKQHKYYLYFKTMRKKSQNVTKPAKPPANPTLFSSSFNSLTFSDSESRDSRENLSGNPSEFEASSVVFCDDSQLFLDNSKKSAKFAKTSSHLFKVRQNIPFKLKNVYTSALSVKKGLKFTVNASNITAKGGPYGQSLQKPATLPPRPLKLSEKPPVFPLKSAQTVEKSTSSRPHSHKNPLIQQKVPIITPESSRSILFVDSPAFSLRELVQDHEFPRDFPTKVAKSPEFRGWQEHSLRVSAQIQDFGVHLFNFHAVAGVSLLIFAKALKNTPPSIAKFLLGQRNLQEKRAAIRKDREKVAQFLTNLQIKEVLEVLNFFTEAFIFREMTFVGSLRFFLANFVIDNDPEKIDLLLYAFSRRYFKEIRRFPLKNDDSRQVFQNFDAVHMLAFAVIMLDIAFHHGNAGQRETGDFVKEFNGNVKGLNDGEDFPRDFLDEIAETVMKNSLIVLKPAVCKENGQEFQVLRDFLEKNADLALKLRKKSTNTGEFKEIELFMLENLGVLLRNQEKCVKSVFLLENCSVKVKGLSFCFAANEKKSNKLIIYGRFRRENGTIAVKYPEILEFLLENAADAKKIISYVEKVTKK